MPLRLAAALVSLAAAGGPAGQPGAGTGASASAADAEAAVEVLEHEGACTGATIRKADWQPRCAPLLVQARYRDGHTSWLFVIEGTAEVSFHGTRDFRRKDGTHVVLVDRLRIKRATLPAQGFCLFTGRFGHPARLVFDGPVSIRCRAGTPDEGDLADLRFQSTGAPVRHDPNGP